MMYLPSTERDGKVSQSLLLWNCKCLHLECHQMQWYRARSRVYQYLREREQERDHHPQEEEEFSRLSESTNKTKCKKGDFFQRLDWDCLLTRIVFIVGCEKIQRERQRCSIAVREFLFVFLTNVTNDLVHINGMNGAPVNSWQAFLEYKRTGFESRRRRSLEVFVSTTTILFVSHCCKFFPAFDEKCFFVVVISSTDCLTTSVVCWRND